MFAYCANSPVQSIDPEGERERLVSIGAQLDVSVGDYEMGIELQVYFDPQVCTKNNGRPIIAVYGYDGACVSVDSLRENPAISQFCDLARGFGAYYAEGVDKTSLIALQATLSGQIDASLSVVGVYGNDKFQSMTDYCGKFDTTTIQANHCKFAYASAPTCSSFSVGATAKQQIDLSFSETNYVLLGFWYL